LKAVKILKLITSVRMQQEEISYVNAELSSRVVAGILEGGGCSPDPTPPPHHSQGLTTSQLSKMEPKPALERVLITFQELFKEESMTPLSWQSKLFAK
jgi:hypothetical protein